MTNNNIMELTKLFDVAKICAPKGEKMFKYGDYVDKDIQSAVETLSEHQTIGDIISFGLAVANFEERYRAKHEGEYAFISHYNWAEGLAQVFLSMYSEWNKQRLDGKGGTYFYNYVYERLTEMQELVDSGDCVMCSHCGSVIDKDYTFYLRGEPYCGHCAHLITIK